MRSEGSGRRSCGPVGDVVQVEACDAFFLDFRVALPDRWIFAGSYAKDGKNRVRRRRRDLEFARSRDDYCLGDEDLRSSVSAQATKLILIPNLSYALLNSTKRSVKLTLSSLS